MIESTQVIGVIYNPSRPSHQILIRSPHRGFIIGHQNVAVVDKGDALFHIGFNTPKSMETFKQKLREGKRTNKQITFTEGGSDEEEM